MFQYFPEQASDFAEKVDWLNSLVTDISVFFTVAIVGTMIYFAIKYRRRNGVDHETPHIEGSLLLEALWTVVPSLICIVVGGLGYVYYDEMRNVPPNARTVNVQGQKWFWSFEYENGKKSRELVVEVNEPVKLMMTSRDTLHSFFIPAMRVKTDVVPGQYTFQWFRPIKTGDYQVFCTEYCGKDHSAMLTRVKVLPKVEYERWLNDKSEEAALARMDRKEVGAQLYSAKGCNACHSLDGSPRVGPSFLKIFGRKEKLSDGTELTVDEEYIRTSIYEPLKQIVQGYPPAMPNYQGQISDDEMLSIVAYLKSLDGTQPIAAPAATVVAAVAEDFSKLPPAEWGKKLFTAKVCGTCHSLDGSKIVGPTFKGIYGRQEKLVDGSTIVVDDAYIKRSILKPMEQVVEGYPPAMPPYEGQFNDAELNALVEYLKTIK
jgi:cytochrome c oxidase subunit II